MRQSVSAILLALGCAALFYACGGEPADEAVVADSMGIEGRMTRPTPALQDSLEAEEQEPLIMPDYPEPLLGHLVTRAAGADEIAGEWPARAGSCEESGTLQVIGEREGTGTILLFFLPPEGDYARSFPVVPVDTTVPEPPAVRVGVQLLRDTRGETFQAIDGTVELAAQDSRVSGRFAISLLNTEANDTALYAGVFSEVRVRPWPPLECPALEEEEPADTLAR
jgi:hypothetical protein